MNGARYVCVNLNEKFESPKVHFKCLLQALGL